ncbi:MAG: PP2C family protein-serine/threonine phosphatase [bacterium]
MELNVRRDAAILIIDDCLISIKPLAAVLKKEGFHVFQAPSGSEGRILAETEKIDLILLDKQMPEEDGFATIKKLKLNPKTAHIPVIFISSTQEVTCKVKGFDLGAVDYITKPFEYAEVLARIRLNIRLQRAQNALVEAQSAKLKHLAEAQQAILIDPEKLPDANFAVAYKPLHEAGGDYFDVIQISDGIFGYFVADVSGHNVGSSLATSALKAIIHQNIGPLYTPIESINMINDIMRLIMADDQFLTLCYAQVNRLRMQLTIISAGHPPPIYIDKEGNASTIITTGDILGAFESISLETKQIDISTGGHLFMYSDGLIENYQKMQKTRQDVMDELLTQCMSTKDSSIDEAVDLIMKNFLHEQIKLTDDVLLLGVEI